MRLKNGDALYSFALIAFALGGLVLVGLLLEMLLDLRLVLLFLGLF